MEKLCEGWGVMEKSKVIKPVQSVGKSEVVCFGNEHGVRYEGGVI